MKAGDFLKKQLQKAGIDITAEALQALFAIDTDLPDENANAADKALLTVDAAMSNSTILNKIKQQTLAGADAKMDAIILELGLVPDNDWPSEKNTYEKIGKLAKLANEAGKKAAGANSKEGAKEWADKEADYNKQLRELKAIQVTKDAEIEKVKIESKTNGRLERQILAKAKELNLPDEMDVDLKIEIVSGVINSKLQSEGLKWALDDTNKLVIVKQDGTAAYDATNVAIQPNTMIDGALAQNKLLKINGGNQQQNSSTTFNGNQIPAGDKSQLQRDAAAAAALKEYGFAV